MEGRQVFIIAVSRDIAGGAKADQRPVEIEDRIRVLILVFGVETGVIGVHEEPGLGLGKAGVPAAGPLDRSPCVVPAGSLDDPEHQLLREEPDPLLVGALGQAVLVFGDVVQRHVAHTQLLALEHEGRALLEHIAGCQSLGALLPVSFAAVAGDHPGMVVVLKIQSVPCPAVQGLLPASEGSLELSQAEGQGQVFLEEAVGLHVLEAEDHVEVGMRPRDERQGFFRAYHRSLPHGEAVVVIQNVSPEFLQILVDLRPAVVEPQALHRPEKQVVRQVLRL